VPKKDKRAPVAGTASANIIERIAGLGDWRGEALARVRRLIHTADPEIQEEWKWRGTPVWSHDGIVCTGASHKQVVKFTFARDALSGEPGKNQRLRYQVLRRSAVALRLVRRVQVLQARVATPDW
jgi:hypothetical protein